VYFGAGCAFNHMSIRDYSIGINEEAAASRELFAACVVSLDGNRGRLDASDELRK
jgi:hypothetical protein